MYKQNKQKFLRISYIQIYPPMLARESAATMTPSLKMKARVVVPLAGFTICTAFF